MNNYYLVAACAILILPDLCSPWLYPCKRIGWGAYTLNKHCTLEHVVIKNNTLLYRVFFPPVDLDIVSGFIPSFDKAVADRMSASTRRLTVTSCGIEQVFLRDTLEYVNLRNNIISEVLFDSPDALKVWSLHLDYNHLRDVSFVRNMTTLVVFTVSKNLIHSVSWDSFKRLNMLLTLDLENNLIKKIDGTGDIRLPSLNRLILAQNKISILDLKRVSIRVAQLLDSRRTKLK